VLAMHHLNFSQRQISEITRISGHFVQNVLRDYDGTNSFLLLHKSTPPKTKVTADVLDYIGIGNSMFGINTTSDISKLLTKISRAGGSG